MGRRNRNRGLRVQGRNSAEIAEVRIQTAMRSFSGPLPPPEVLARYDEILPGAAERILAMAESQHDHRQGLERTVVDSNVTAQKLGTILGFVVAMTAIIGGSFLIYAGKETGGLTTVITAVASLVGVFVYSKHEQQKDLKRKTEDFAEAVSSR